MTNNLERREILAQPATSIVQARAATIADLTDSSSGLADPPAKTDGAKQTLATFKPPTSSKCRQSWRRKEG